MAEVGSQAGRVRIEQTADGVVVRMPGPRIRWAALGLVLLLPASAYLLFGSLIFGNAVLEFATTLGAVPGVLAAAALLLVPLMLDGVVLVALVVLLYHVFGAEVVTATPWMLTDTCGVLLLGRRRRWPAMRVSDLRLSPMAGGDHDPRFLTRRGILFEVDGRRTRAIAQGCTPREAAEVFAAVHDALTRPTVTR